MTRYENPVPRMIARIEGRTQFFRIFLAFCFFLLVTRVIHIHLKDGRHLESVASRQYRAYLRGLTERGQVLDRNGVVLAVSEPAMSLFVDPSLVAREDLLVQTLERHLNVSSEALLSKLKQGGRFVWVKRHLTPEEYQHLGALKLSQLFSEVSFVQENHRFYPYDSLAAPVIGAVGFDGQPLGGIELYYDDYLFRVAPTGDWHRDARGQLYLADFDVGEEAKMTELILTIDKDIQFLTEQVLSDVVDHNHAKGGVAIVYEPTQGEVLALAQVPSFNPNRLRKQDIPWVRARAITDSFEPGSTFKVFIAAAALEKEVADPQERFDCENGKFKIPGTDHEIHDHKPFGHLTFSEIIRNSSNIGIYKVSTRLKREELYSSLNQFGFGEPTGIDYPSESRGMLRDFRKWHPTERATIAFGQGIAVTPIQMVVAFGAMANGGLRMRPYLIRSVHQGGKILFEMRPKALGQAISQGTATKLKAILREVVSPEGTGRYAQSLEYTIGGKTGTSQKVIPGGKQYAEDRFVASFIGMAPLLNPRLVVYVMIDEPHGGKSPGGIHTGGLVAAPAFKEIMVRSLHYLGVPPDASTAGDRKQLPNNDLQEIDGPYRMASDESNNVD